MDLSLANIAYFSGGTLQQGNGENHAYQLCHDTRRLTPGDLYLALEGERFDGREFLPQAIEQGAIGAIIKRPLPRKLLHLLQVHPNFGLILVDNPLLALQQLARQWRSTISLQSIVITGSNGKTSTKNFLHQLLQDDYSCSVTAGNYNNHIGLPLTILSAAKTNTVGIWEIGMNHAGEIAPLAAIARPQIAIITNIGKAHIGNLGSQENIAHEKGSLLRALPAGGIAILPGETPFLELLKSKIPQQGQIKTITIGLQQGDIIARDITAEREGTSFTLIGNLNGKEIQEKCFLPLWGNHMVYNAAVATVAATTAGLPLEKAVLRLHQLQPMAGRLQIYHTSSNSKNDCLPTPLTLLDDSYNASPDSMKAALATLSTVAEQQKGPRRKVAILGKMGELGSLTEEIYNEIGQEAAQHADILIVVGEEASSILTAAQKNLTESITSTAPKAFTAYFAPDLTAAEKLIKKISQPGDIYLVKGSRVAQLDLLVKKLLDDLFS